MEINKIAVIHTDFQQKFGIPRQSGLVPGLTGRIEFLPEYRNPDAIKGLEGYSHLWLIWGFSESVRSNWTATVRPPRLGGNQSVGVFASRSPFRPNAIGLSSVKLEKIVIDEKLGPVLHVSGIDMLDGTPIYDIKPYLPHVDSHPDALGGFAAEVKEHELEVVIPDEWKCVVSQAELENIVEILKQDPRTAYVKDEERVWGMSYAGYNVKFTVKDEVVTVCEIKGR